MRYPARNAGTKRGNKGKLKSNLSKGLLYAFFFVRTNKFAKRKKNSTFYVTSVHFVRRIEEKEEQTLLAKSFRVVLQLRTRMSKYYESVKG